MVNAGCADPTFFVRRNHRFEARRSALRGKYATVHPEVHRKVKGAREEHRGSGGCSNETTSRALPAAHTVLFFAQVEAIGEGSK